MAFKINHPGAHPLQDPPGILFPGCLRDLGVRGHGEGQVLDTGAVGMAANDIQGQVAIVYIPSGCQVYQPLFPSRPHFSFRRDQATELSG
jgi:hypothetical protein